MVKQNKRYFDKKDESSAKKAVSNGRKHSNKVNQQNNDVEVFNVNVNLKRWKRKHEFSKNTNVKPKNIKHKYPGKAPVAKELLEKHSRGDGIGIGVKHPILLEKLKRKEKNIDYANEQAARAEILLTEEQGFLKFEEDGKTTSVTQKQIVNSIDIAAATKSFELQLEDFGPYRIKYSRNGRHLLLGGKKGHIAAFDWVTKRLHCEISVMETIHDLSFLHLESMFAVAQKEWLYIYDNSGIELHCLKKMDKILRMEFLPYHFLLATVNEFGYMTWLDVSVGEIVAQFNNKNGRTSVMTHNPYNATICLGNSKGVVSIWSPTVQEPLAKILCHKSPVTAASVDPRGVYMATSGVDRSLKIWDIRNLNGPLQHYKLRSAPVDLDFSQKQMLAVGLNDAVEIYNDCCVKSTVNPYLRHRLSASIGNHSFCPYEDVLGVATSKGFVSVIVPGSGEPNFDALESNPFQTKMQRREAEVKALLEKIPADLITLNPFDVTEVDVPTLKDKLEAKSSLMFLKPRKVDFTPRKKNAKHNASTRKRIIKETVKKEFISNIRENAKLLQDTQPESVPKKSFGVLDRFVRRKN